MDAAVEARGVCLDMPVYGAARPGLRRALLQAAARWAIPGAGSRHTQLRALDEVSFRIEEGQRVALIGRNGAGKTTLLNVLAGYYSPTRGSISVKGRISTLLALVDPDPDGTVVENIRLSGILRGVRGAGLTRLVDDVLDFAELEAYADMPVRVLSAGMGVRLSYGVATSISCDVLLVDEIIGVGDAAFVARASRRFHDAARNISVLVLATHALALAQEFCGHGILLDHGSLVSQGPLLEVNALYQTRLIEAANATVQPAPFI